MIRSYPNGERRYIQRKCGHDYYVSNRADCNGKYPIICADRYAKANYQAYSLSTWNMLIFDSFIQAVAYMRENTNELF